MINLWIILPILAAFLWASVNHLDKYLLSKFCKNREIGGLVIFSGIIGVPVSIIIYLLFPSVINIDPLSSLILIVAGSIYLAGIIPYLYALEQSETSSVAPQMLMIPAIAGILGYIFLNEILSRMELIGSMLLLIGTYILSFDEKFQYRKFKISNTFYLMLLSSTLLASHSFLFKFMAIETDFWTTIFWIHIGFFLLTIFLFFLIPQYKKQFFALIRTNPLKITILNIFSETINIIGNLSFYYGALLAPLAIAQVISEGIQPFFVLVIGIFLTFFFPNLGKEKINSKIMFKKISAISVMAIGLYLVIN